MEGIEEMTDAQLVSCFTEFDLHITDDCGERYEAMRSDIIRRLSTHPAQRIADLTGQWITKNAFDSWLLWDFGVDPVFVERAQTWASYSKDHHPYHIIDLPDDNRPWQESIYKPQVSVENGGKDGNE